MTDNPETSSTEAAPQMRVVGSSNIPAEPVSTARHMGAFVPAPSTIAEGDDYPAFDEDGFRASLWEPAVVPPADVPDSFTVERFEWSMLSPEDRTALLERMQHIPPNAPMRDEVEQAAIREWLSMRGERFRRIRTLSTSNVVHQTALELETEAEQLQQVIDKATEEMAEVSHWEPGEDGKPVPVLRLRPYQIAARQQRIEEAQRQLSLKGPGGVEASRRLKDAEELALSQAKAAHQRAREEFTINREAKAIAFQNKVRKAAERRARIMDNEL